MVIFAALLCAMMMLLNVVLHVLLILNFPLGEYVNGGQYKVIPPRRKWLSTFFAVVWSFSIYVYLVAWKIIENSSVFFSGKVFLYVLMIFHAFAIIGNAKLTKSKKERYLMTPLSVVVFIGTLYLVIFS